MTNVSVLIAGQSYEASPECPVLFGRADDLGVVGLDPRDMGISARAGSIEYSFGVWWVINRSQTRRLFVESSPASSPNRLECGGRHALTTRQPVVLVPGAIYTHRIDVCVPEGFIAALRVDTPVTTGTMTFGELRLSERDREALVAVCCGYLRSFPRHDPHPLSYQDAADLLGAPWTKVTVRKQVERIKERLARKGLFLDGPHANHDLAQHLIDNGLLGIDDLARLDRSAVSANRASSAPAMAGD